MLDKLNDLAWDAAWAVGTYTIRNAKSILRWLDRHA